MTMRSHRPKKVRHLRLRQEGQRRSITGTGTQMGGGKRGGNTRLSANSAAGVEAKIQKLLVEGKTRKEARIKLGLKKKKPKGK